MFQGWNTASLTNTVSLICGFLIIFSGVYLLDMIAPLSNVTSSSLLELPFSSSSCRVSSIAVATVVTEKSCWDEYTDDEGEGHPNAISRRRPSSSSRPRALSVWMLLFCSSLFNFLVNSLINHTCFLYKKNTWLIQHDINLNGSYINCIFFSRISHQSFFLSFWSHQLELVKK